MKHGRWRGMGTAALTVIIIVAAVTMMLRRRADGTDAAGLTRGLASAGFDSLPS